MDKKQDILFQILVDTDIIKSVSKIIDMILEGEYNQESTEESVRTLRGIIYEKAENIEGLVEKFKKQ